MMGLLVTFCYKQTRQQRDPGSPDFPLRASGSKAFPPILPFLPFPPIDVNLPVS